MSDFEAVDFFVSFWMPGRSGTRSCPSCSATRRRSTCRSRRARSSAGIRPARVDVREFDLIYVVGDERDIVGVRTNHRDEQVFMYRINTTPEGARSLLDVFIERINELADEAEFYHLVSNSCTINIVRYARSLTPVVRFDPRFYLNGLVDRFLYAAGAVDTSVPLPELHAQANITQVADS